MSNIVAEQDTATTTHSAQPVRIREAVFGEVAFYATDDVPAPPGEDMGRILIRLNVDGMGPIVNVDLGRTDQLEALDDAIETLRQVRDDLGRIYGERRDGQCLTSGDWGRCKSATGHGGDHDFPTE